MSKIKRGTIRDDGLVFWEYRKARVVSERWLTKQEFEHLSARIKSNREKYISVPENRERARKYTQERRADPAFKAAEAQRRKEIRESDPSIRQKAAAYRRHYYNENPLYAMASCIRSRTGQAIRSKGFPKTGRTEEILGCSFEELKIHLENQFTEGMSWDNFGKWHIDHVIPLSSACNEDEMLKLCKYENTQPLWAADNQKKLNKMPPPKP